MSTHDKEGRQSALLQAATEAFARRGYEATTTREIAEQAGCSEGLIHRYFGGKAGLLAAILKRDASHLREAQSPSPSDDLFEEISALLSWQLLHFWQNKSFMKVAVTRATLEPEVGRFVGEGIYGARVAAFQERLRRHQEAGRIRPGVDLEALAQALVGLGFSLGFAGQIVFQWEPGETTRIAAAVARLLSGVAAPPEDGG